MPSNIELKARDKDPTRTRALAQQLSDAAPVQLVQEDTFFSCPHGRLKLRRITGAESELIFYRRPDIAGIKQSDYLIAPVTNADQLGIVLAAAFGRWRTVVKTRVLFQVGQTRIHLDQVERLGSFVELEVVLQEGQAAQEGDCIARELMAQLRIRAEDLLEGAYVDLLEEPVQSQCGGWLRRAGQPVSIIG